MDNRKNLAENLLKADGIDPSGTLEAERIAFGKMLDGQLKSKPSGPISRPQIWRILMNSKFTKYAAAAVVLIAAIAVVNALHPKQALKAVELAGPQHYTLYDGSTVVLDEKTTIKTYSGNSERGFELIVGRVDVSVVKDSKPFIVRTSLGQIKALGTRFKVDLINDQLPDNRENVILLAVNVTEGLVQISNAHGSINAAKDAAVTMQKDAPPYDFRQDENLPKRLRDRIGSMLEAIETGDKKLYVSNYNMQALFELITGKISYKEHPDWFSGMSPDDAANIRQNLAHIESPEQLIPAFIESISDNRHTLYVSSVTLSPDKLHAMAVCVERRDNRTLKLTPQWTYFRDDWWQTDD